jgi:hypothetical protein
MFHSSSVLSNLITQPLRVSLLELLSVCGCTIAMQRTTQIWKESLGGHRTLINQPSESRIDGSRRSSLCLSAKIPATLVDHFYLVYNARCSGSYFLGVELGICVQGDIMLLERVRVRYGTVTRYTCSGPNRKRL